MSFYYLNQDELELFDLRIFGNFFIKKEYPTIVVPGEDMKPIIKIIGELKNKDGQILIDVFESMDEAKHKLWMIFQQLK